ncbi:MAG: hypothetical protein P8Y64_11805 [Gammaproteobacteria bacterium]|jgi:hypothetical protein
MHDETKQTPDADGPPPINDRAIVIEGTAHNGKPCRIVDNTGSIDRAELQALLDQLIADRCFGLTGRSLAGSNAITLGQPDFTHIQIGTELYRLILFPYEARIEAF